MGMQVRQNSPVFEWIGEAERMKNVWKRAAACLLFYIETFLFLEISGLFFNTAVTAAVSACFAYLFWRNRQSIAFAFRRPKPWTWIFVSFLALSLILGSKLNVTKDSLYDEYWVTYADPLKAGDLVSLLLVLPFLYALVVLVMQGLDHLTAPLSEKSGETISRRDIRKIFWIVTLILFACMLPYLLIHWPGLIYGDSLCSIYQYEGEMAYYDQFPVVYTLFIGLFLTTGKVLFHSINAGCALYSLVQMFALCAGCAYIVIWLLRKQVNRKLLYFAVLFYALTPMISLFGISMWKDPLFSMALAFYCLKLYDFVTGSGKSGKATALSFAGLLAVIGFFRSNGPYVILFTLFILLIFKLRLKDRMRMTKWFWLVHAFVIAVVLVVTGPVCSAAGVEKHPEESLSVPLQQMAAAVVYDGKMSDAERNVVGTILPLDEYKEIYQPGIVDVIKWDDNFNVEYVRAERGEILKTWISIGAKNPGIYLRAWSLNTFGYWAVDKWDLNLYVGNITRAGFPSDMDLMGIEFDDLLDGLPFIPKALTSVMHPMPALALCTWLMLLSAAYALSRKRPLDSLLFVPCLASILTLLIAAPDCYWPRYGFSVYYLLPVVLMFPGIFHKTESNSKSMSVKHEN
jgi:hypothetical protein